MKSKSLSTFITAVIYCFTIVLHTKAETIEQYNVSDIAIKKIVQLGHKASNLKFQSKVSDRLQQ